LICYVIDKSSGLAVRCKRSQAGGCGSDLEIRAGHPLTSPKEEMMIGSTDRVVNKCVVCGTMWGNGRYALCPVCHPPIKDADSLPCVPGHVAKKLCRIEGLMSQEKEYS